MRPAKSVRIVVMALLGSLASVSSSAAAKIPSETHLEQPAGDTVARLAKWVVASGDNRGMPYAIVDKVAAKVFVFGADGEMRGAAQALLGLAQGDDSIPGIGDRQLANIPPEERTTPAGRFVSAFGKAAGGQRVFWVDYATALSLHPVVTANRKERRLQRLATPVVDDNRITYGCINVSTSFFEDVVRKTFEGTTSVVYILPDSKLLSEVFPAFSLSAEFGRSSAAVGLGEP